VRKYKRFLWLVAPLVIISIIMSACGSSNQNSSTTISSSPNQALSSTTKTSKVANTTTASASAGYDWSKVPVYAGSTEATDLENAQGGPSPQIRVYVANVSPVGKVIDYYSSELPNNGWTVTDTISGIEVLATNGSYDLTVEVTAMTNDNYPSDNCEINFNMLPH
jgi:hypothetical protein